MKFVLFGLLNAFLLIRPEELIPGLAGTRLYLITILACVLVSLPEIVGQLQPAALQQRPITVCVLGVWLAGILSHLVRGYFGLALDFAGEFGKVVLYYLVLVSAIDTPGRLRTFLGWITVFVVVLTTLGLLQFHEVIDLEVLRPLERRDWGGTEGDPTLIVQLRSTGIYNDPNDLCLILVTGSICALYRAVNAAHVVTRLAWLAPIGLFGYAVMLTQSRGGVLGLGAAILVWAYSAFGWRRTALGALAAIPLAAAALSGSRQADMDLGQGDTGHQRLMLWNDGFMLMMRNPVTGMGVGEYGEETGIVVHNSFVHAYVEMGLIGGSLYLAAFFFGALALHRVRHLSDPTLVHLRPFVLAIVIGYAGGSFTLSRTYVVPTCMIFGLATAFLQLADTAVPAWFRFDGRFFGWLVGLGIVGLIGLKVLTQVLLALGG